MAKLMTMFLVLIAMQAALIIYTDQSPVDSDIWNFVMNMNMWGTLAFILALVGIAAGIGVLGIAAASTFGFKTDFLIFAPAVAGLISMGVIFTNLARALSDDLRERFFYCAPEAANYATCLTTQDNIVTLIVALTIGPIALYYVWTIIEWWRGKDY